MIDREKNTMVCIKVSKLVYQFIKKYSDIAGISITAFCCDAITDKIMHLGLLPDVEKNKELQFESKIHE